MTKEFVEASDLKNALTLQLIKNYLDSEVKIVRQKQTDIIKRQTNGTIDVEGLTSNAISGQSKSDKMLRLINEGKIEAYTTLLAVSSVDDLKQVVANMNAYTNKLYASQRRTYEEYKENELIDAINVGRVKVVKALSDLLSTHFNIKLAD